MRYYHEEHEAAYRRIVEQDFTQWNDLFDPVDTWTYDRFQNRAFLKQVLAHLDLPPHPAPTVLEYGCGTGPAACFLASRGFEVEAVDLIPDAIEIAQRMAAERGVRADFRVADICHMASHSVARRHDIVLDSYCLQSIVTDADRQAVFAAAKAHLKPTGAYIISTALFGPHRAIDPDYPRDATTGIVYRPAPDGQPTNDAVEIDGRLFIPHRRHLTPEALRTELTVAGFAVLDLDGPDPGDVICRLART